MALVCGQVGYCVAVVVAIAERRSPGLPAIVVVMMQHQQPLRTRASTSVSYLSIGLAVA